MIRQPVFSRDGKRIAYRIMEPDSSLGGAADPVGLYIVGADGKDGRFLAPATGVAQFSTDDRRIYFFGAPDYDGGKAVVLQSIGVDGGEVKDHAHAQTADTGDFTLSPDFKWIAFKELNQLYVMPYREGDASVAITAVGNTSARQLTQTGAYEPMWSADSATLAWMLGHDLHATSPDRSGSGIASHARHRAVREDRCARRHGGLRQRTHSADDRRAHHRARRRRRRAQPHQGRRRSRRV